MQTIGIYLESMDKIREFENAIGRYDCKFEIVSGGFIADAKSVMALFALDLSKKHELRIIGEDQDMIQDVKEVLKGFTERAAV